MNIIFTRKITISMPYGNLIFFSKLNQLSKEIEKKNTSKKKKKAGQDGVFIYMYLLTSGFHQYMILQNMLTIC